MKLLILAILLLSFAAATECEGSVSLGLPAVSGSSEGTAGGSIVPVEMRLVDGSGGAYINTVPNTDSGLQESFSIAADVAREHAQDGEECDALLSIKDKSEFVQGPSGGAAFAIMAYSLFSGEEFVRDATMTGAISEDGHILPVGGLYEKALSAKAVRKEYILTPIQSIGEKLLLEGISGITIYEVETFEEAMDFFFDGIAPQERPLNLSVAPLPELEDYSGDKNEDFKGITEGIIEREEEAIGKLSDAAIRAYYLELVSQQQELIEKGYYYSAANGAFLNFIMADSLLHIEEPDVEGKIAEVEACLGGVEEARLTYDNYEWVMGAQARTKRAQNQLELFRENDANTREEEYLVVYELNYALAWCDAAAQMQETAKRIGGEFMDEELMRQKAEMFVNFSSNYSYIGEAETYQNGMEMYEEGRYAGAVYELAYSISFEKTYEIVEEEGSEALDISQVNYGSRETLWGSTFRAHSDYLAAVGDMEGAYAVALFSYAMEGIGQQVGDARAAGLFAGNESGDTEGAECECPACTEGICAGALALLMPPLLPLFIKNIQRK
jgi:predicted S18 family serine protease